MTIAHLTGSWPYKPPKPKFNWQPIITGVFLLAVAFGLFLLVTQSYKR